MRLNKIKLAGFKSFVDPTTVNLPSNLIGVVGPNGCGKSNIIDAIRWVMGESSAKNLRGESMADVIFSGSSARKPVGTASIELVFDNADGTVGGQYASFAEISIKRVVSRDGTSDYFLNNSRCRRKDITSIFLGTGLGARSYSIIEQGTISRLVEARPEEMRIFLEEAAGISKYKDRRRETELRIRHTRENLERLGDLRDEVDKQIRNLQRQARVAERYKGLKAEERELSAQLLALRLRALDTDVERTRTELESAETALQAAIAEQRGHESALERTRARQAEVGDAFNEVQGAYYREGADISRLEQSIQHGRELRQRQQTDLRQVEQSVVELNEQIGRDERALGEISELLATLEPDLEQASARQQATAAALAEAEEARSRWQERWDAFNGEAGSAQQTGQVERARIEQLEGQLKRLMDRQQRHTQEQADISIDELERALAEVAEESERRGAERDRARERVQALAEETGTQRQRDSELTAELDLLRSGLQQARGRLASVEALQQAALGKTDERVTGWLSGQGLDANPRLAQLLNVEPGWERAVETVLGDYLQAVCVDGVEPLAALVADLDEASLSLIERRTAGSPASAGTLAAHVSAEQDLHSLLGSVLAAADLGEALSLRAGLAPGQSVITADGVWLGRDWLRVSRVQDERSGVIEREREMRELHERIEHDAARVSELETEHRSTRERLVELEEARTAAQQELSAVTERLATLQAGRDSARSRLEQARARLERLQREGQEMGEEIAAIEARLREARGRLEGALAEMQRLEQERERLMAEREQGNATLRECRERHEAARRESQETAIRVESRRSARESATVNLERMRRQLEQFEARRQELGGQLGEGEAPLQEQERRLAELLEQRVSTEQALTEARRQVESVEAELRDLEQKRSRTEQRVSEARETVDGIRLHARELSVRRENLMEQFTRTGLELAQVVEALPEGASVGDWEQRLATASERIQRLGPINLASIDELKEQSERKEYLDSQNNDLSEALETLENAIRKIDRETRTRFKETYDRVNAGLGALFPRLFGGGHAYLELTGEDMLESGVTVMARPPGKRNTSIHLLSGGEKALTAVALVFSIFQLNPAPFCLLDEVDAPLDDANVGRFCEIVKEMSEKVQFIFITHNKTTMEMAHQLAGVTMNEPGVSRMVAVDIDEAVKMAAM